MYLIKQNSNALSSWIIHRKPSLVRVVADHRNRNYTACVLRYSFAKLKVVKSLIDLQICAYVSSSSYLYLQLPTYRYYIRHSTFVCYVTRFGNPPQAAHTQHIAINLVIYDVACIVESRMYLLEHTWCFYDGRNPNKHNVILIYLAVVYVSFTPLKRYMHGYKPYHIIWSMHGARIAHNIGLLLSYIKHPYENIRINIICYDTISPFPILIIQIRCVAPIIWQQGSIYCLSRYIGTYLSGYIQHQMSQSHMRILISFKKSKARYQNVGIPICRYQYYTQNMKLPHNITVIAASNTYYTAPESTFI